MSASRHGTYERFLPREITRNNALQPTCEDALAERRR
jgi:hypothetical protein